MINKKQFIEMIVRPALKAIALWSEEAEALVVETCMQESRLTFLKQYPTGPALGVIQMETFTYQDIWSEYLQFRMELADKLRKLAVSDEGVPPPDELIYNLRFAVAMCRIHYRRKPGVIPKTLEGRASYWKEHYNTPEGKGVVDEYIRNNS